MRKQLGHLRDEWTEHVTKHWREIGAIYAGEPGTKLNGYERVGRVLAGTNLFALNLFMLPFFVGLWRGFAIALGSVESGYSNFRARGLGD